MIGNFYRSVILVIITFLASPSAGSAAALLPQHHPAHNPAPLAAQAAVRTIADRTAAAGSCGASYTVQAGDTLSGIAAQCGVSLNTLAKTNGLVLTDPIYPGQKLAIPQAGASAAAPAKPTPAWDKTACTNPYTVKGGDTLGKIAKLCRISIKNLKLWNSLKSDTIRVGQKLNTRAKNLLPGVGGAAPAPPSPAPPSPAPTPTVMIESAVK